MDNKPWDDTLAKLSLAGIILMVVLLHTFVAYAIYERFRGKCDKCAMNEDKLRKWESGELKRITKDMVMARGTLDSRAPGSTAAPNGSEIDIEAGIVRDSTAEQTAHRANALAALNCSRSVLQKPLLFEQAKGALKPKGKRPPPVETPKSPSPAQFNPNPSHDRFFAVAEPVTVGGPRYVPSHQPYVEDYYDSHKRLNNRAYDPPRPKNPTPPGSPTPPDSPTSIYSYDGESADKFAVRPLSELPPIRSQSPNESVVSSALHIYDPRHRARYADAQRKMEQGTAPDAELQKAVQDVNAIEVQMRGKRRTRAYGGLPDPES